VSETEHIRTRCVLHARQTHRRSATTVRFHGCFLFFCTKQKVPSVRCNISEQKEQLKLGYALYRHRSHSNIYIMHSHDASIVVTVQPDLTGQASDSSASILSRLKLSSVWGKNISKLI
jgi:hypothetical protein